MKVLHDKHCDFDVLVEYGVASRRAMQLHGIDVCYSSSILRPMTAEQKPLLLI